MKDALPGEIVAIDGHPLHVVAEGAGSPPVLFSSGLGGAWFDWTPVMNLVRKRHRSIAFDRPGLGGSRPVNAPADLRDEADRLAGLARWAGPPVIVVAHSFAGLHAEAFARLHPDLVSGVVLVDPSCELDRPSLARLLTRLSPAARLTGRLMGATGLTRVLGPYAHGAITRLAGGREVAPDNYVRAVYGQGHVLGTVLAEGAAYRQMAADLLTLRDLRPFPRVPLRVFTALGDMRGEAKRAWERGHATLARMSPHGRQIVLHDAGHLFQSERPEVIAEAVAGLC